MHATVVAPSQPAEVPSCEATPSASKLTIMPVRPASRSGRRPQRSTRAIATTVASTLTTPIPIVAASAVVALPQPAASQSRRQLREVERRRDGGEADRDTDHEAPDDQGGDVRRGRGHERAEDERRAAGDVRWPSSDRIRRRPAEQRTGERSERHDTDDEPLRGGAETEVGNDEEQRTRDHAGVEAEEETSERSDQRDERRIRYGAASGRGLRGSFELSCCGCH